MHSLQKQSEVLRHLVVGTINGELPADGDLSTETLSLAKDNGIHFYLLSLLASASGSNGVAGELKREHARLNERQRHVEEEAARLHHFFAGRGLPVFFIKDFMRYPFTDHDVDCVAAQRSHVKTYRARMKEVGYRYRFGKSQLREPDKYFYYPISVRDEFADIRFHLHKALSWNGVVFLDSEAVLGRCREEKRAEGSFLVPSYEDEILIMAAHALFENASIRLGEILELGLLVRDERIDWGYLIDTVTRHNWQAALAFFLEAVWAALANARSVNPSPHIREWSVKKLAEAGVIGGDPVSD